MARLRFIFGEPANLPALYANTLGYAQASLASIF